MTYKDKVHADIIVVMRGGPFGDGTKPEAMTLVAHGDVDGATESTKRLRELSSLLHQGAWTLETLAEKIDSGEIDPSLRAFEDSQGNHWFEVKKNVFITASDRREAEALFAAGANGTSESTLRATYANLKEMK